MSNVIRLVLAIATLALFACAMTPPQVPVQTGNALLANKGDRVQLFYGGSKAAKEEFCLNAEVPVYRYEGRNSTLGSTGTARREVGKIKVTKDVGDYYLEAVVIEGSVRSGDIAVQPQTGCLINTEPQ